MKYVIIFAKDEQGQEIKYRFMISMKKKLIGETAKDIFQALSQVDGIDRAEPVGFYTMDISIGRAFDPEEVLKNLCQKLDVILLDIIVPSKDIKI